MLDCTRSSVDASRLASEGVIRILLGQSDNTPYFGSFDVQGGQAIGAAPFTNTGAGAGTLSNNFAGSGETSTQKWFDIAYTPIPGATSDVIIIQETENDSAVNDACVLSFNIANTSTPELDCSRSTWR